MLMPIVEIVLVTYISISDIFTGWTVTYLNFKIKKIINKVFAQFLFMISIIFA